MQLRCVFAIVLGVTAIAWTGLAGVPASAALSAHNGMTATTPEPRECTVAPRSIAEVRALLPTPGPPLEQTATPVPSTYHHVPASAEVVAGIEATAREMVACVNAGDVLRMMALYSDHLLQSGSLTTGDVDLEAPPAPLPPRDRMALLGVVYVRQFDDGRAGAVMLTDDPRIPSPVEPSFFFFAKVGDRWLVDEYPVIFQFSFETLPVEGLFDLGTPAP